MAERENFKSRLGFILIAAGCAIGLGNVWRFPFITGQYGGAAFVLIYLFFLLIFGCTTHRKFHHENRGRWHCQVRLYERNQRCEHFDK